MIRLHITTRNDNQTPVAASVSSAFTIVELLVVIVVIGILAAITVVSYTGVINRALVTSLQSDLSNASIQLKQYQMDNSAYPNSVTDCPSPGAGNLCLKASNGASFNNYIANNLVNPQTFSLIETTGDGATSYAITDNTAPSQTYAASCPSGYIPVPGSGTYGTNAFCVMKYEAKNDGSGKAVSVASGTPWVSISQTSAITTAQNACSGCHLITEAEWMTLAQNVLSVPSNWSSGSVGSGYIDSGHNDDAPDNALAADSNDSNGYSGEIYQGGSQRRTLTLTNGQVIWDFAGNVWEWTSGQTAGHQPGIDGGGYAWRELKNLTDFGSLSVNPFPTGTGLSGASSWTSSNGIGKIYSSSDDSSLHGFMRGGGWKSSSTAGILAPILDTAPGNSNGTIGFRTSI